MAKYVHDDNNNRIEALSKEEIYALIDEVIASGELPSDVPPAFVTMLKSIVDGNAYKIGFCTQAEYNQLEAQGLLVADTLYIITDDQTEQDLEDAIEDLDERVTTLEDKHLYRHIINFTGTNYQASYTLYTNKNTAITTDNIFNYFDNGTNYLYLNANGVVINNNVYCQVYYMGINKYTSTIKLFYIYNSNTADIDITSSVSITDNITQVD